MYGQKKGALSQRMQLEGNIWMEMWQHSTPVPAHRQKRLFDDTKEAEKVLQFLGNMPLFFYIVQPHATHQRQWLHFLRGLKATNVAGAKI